ncbi:hypothetical protein JYA60_02010 [Sphingomonas yabuuchiae]|uniref:Uncharacterized protein n=2 Tax=Sphingomonas yabuuchiae TaxID=172044 RepID=A0AA41DBQ2_9SPHN|nr:hypothetical protein [Sphingomonas yabuuchiae]MBN3557009.1 hypothetical protein [Sphingomonas yabuuchiae]
MAFLCNEDAHGMTVLAMSSAEITRFDSLIRLDCGEIRIADAMELLGFQRRQVYRLLDRLRQEVSCPLLSGPSTMTVWTKEGTTNAFEEAQA